MSEMNDVNQTGGQEERPVAFCQNCGRPLTVESRRVVGPAVYCEQCLEARLSGAPAGAGAAAGGFPPVYPAVPAGASEVPNPGLAALLGLIPGVGAMYNEQYAKGIVHLVIFAVLVSFTHVFGLFLLFVFGWVAYMAIEAHHTARARRDGTPLPNPFGFNDIGERMGFGRAWPQGAGVGAVVRDAAAAVGFQPGTPGYGGAAYGAAPVTGSSTRSGFGAGAAAPPPASGAADPAAAAGAGWGAPVDAYPGATAYGAGTAAAGFSAVPGTEPAAGYPAGGYAGQPYGGPGYTGAAYGAPAYGVPAYGAGHYGAPAYGAPTYGAGVYGAPDPSGSAFVPPIPPVPPPVSRFPAGAIWLIGLGTIFLLGTTGIFRGFPGRALVGLVLIGLGVWNFIRRMTDSGLPLGDDGTPMYRLRLVRAIRSAAWLTVLGVLFLLDQFHVVGWAYSWPWLIILGGVLMLLNRATYRMPMTPYAGGAMPAAAAPASPGTGIVPSAPPRGASETDAEYDIRRSELKQSETHEGGN